MKLFFLFVFTLLAINVSGQDYLIYKLGITHYYYQGEEYNWKEIGGVYAENEEANILYNEGRKNLKLAKKIFFRGAITIGVGVITMLLVNESKVERHARVAVGYGIFVELGALIHLFEWKKNLSRAKSAFNFEMMKRFGYNSEVSLAFGGTSSGVGLLLQF